MRYLTPSPVCATTWSTRCTTPPENRRHPASRPAGFAAHRATWGLWRGVWVDPDEVVFWLLMALLAAVVLRVLR